MNGFHNFIIFSRTFEDSKERKSFDETDANRKIIFSSKQEILFIIVFD